MVSVRAAADNNIIILVAIPSEMKGYKDLSLLSFLTRKVYVVPYLRTTPHGQAIKRPVSIFIMRIGTNGYLTRGKNRKNPFNKGERNLSNGEVPPRVRRMFPSPNTKT